MARALMLRLLVILLLIPHSVRCQDICENLLSDNTLVVDAQALTEMQTNGASFQDLVDCVDDGGRVLLEVETLELNGTLNVNKGISIQSSMATGSSLSCNAGNPIFEISASNVEISSLSITGCDMESDDAPIVVLPGSGVVLANLNFTQNVNSVGPAAIRLDSSTTMDIRDSHFRQNVGGAASVIKAGRASEITISNCLFENNTGMGTVVATDVRSTTITRSRFVNNSASRFGGGALRINSTEVDTLVLVEDRTAFHTNTARGGDGGAILTIGSVSLTITSDTHFIGNSARRRGGAIAVRGSSTVSIRNAVFTENASNFTGGGAIYAEKATDGIVDINISETLFARNAARNYLGSGGALRLRGRGIRCSLSDTVSFVANTAELDGGGVHVSHVREINITGASFVGNEALSGGAAALYIVAIERAADVETHVKVDHSSFLFNRALNTNRGGGTIGLIGSGTEMRVTDSEFSDNDAGIGSGGVFYLFDGPVVTLVNAKFQRNRAVWGGALYAENEARFHLELCEFSNNIANQGGAVHVRGNVDMNINECTFENNSAITEGGAFALHNSLISGDEISAFLMINSTMIGNKAGANLFEDALYGTETGGGGILAEGGGISLDLRNNTFQRNEGSQGGALNIKTVADCQTQTNKFENNTANFGGAVFVLVSERSRPRVFPFYDFNDEQFDSNTALFGGGMYVDGGKTTVDGVSLNARFFIVDLRNCRFTHNRASRGGGGLALSGSGVKVGQSCLFQSNTALPTTEFVHVAWGGAVLVENGAVLESSDTKILENEANIGGAVLIRDASMKATRVTFSDNRATDNGVGGAVAIEVSASKDIPVLVSQNRLRNILFESGDCTFTRNEASLRGGALHLHHIDPATNFTLDAQCRDQADQAGTDDTLTCETQRRYLDRLEGRSVRLRNTQFVSNHAPVGGAIFGNDPAMIVATPDLVTEDGLELSKVLRTEDTVHLAASGIVFRGNRISERGYGQDYATTPVAATLRRRSRQISSVGTNLTVDDLTSGDTLNFMVSFVDALGEIVRLGLNLTATIEPGKQNSNGERLEVSGQRTANPDVEGMIDFSGTRLRGIPDQRYLLHVIYHPADRSMTFDIPASTIEVSMQRCRIGEQNLTEGKTLRCQACNAGTFTSDPTVSCSDCAANGECLGNTVIPHDNFWHATSYSQHEFIRCVGQEACSFGDRRKTILEKTGEAHRNGTKLDYTKDDNDLLCRTGYQGPLCGSCQKGYGKENNRCVPCRSTGLRGFLLFLFILWSFLFLSYFIRSVLQLVDRIEFNRRFNHVPTELEMRMKETIPPPVVEAESEVSQEELPGQPQGMQSEITPSPLGESTPSFLYVSQLSLDGLETLPTKKDLARLAANKIQLERKTTKTLERNDSQQTSTPKKHGRLARKLQTVGDRDSEEKIEPLTLANPVSEILKILVNFLQVTATALIITVDWSTPLRRTLVAIDVASSVSSGSGIVSLDCFMDPGSTPKSLRRMVVKVLFPLLMFLFYTPLWGTYTFLKQHSKKYFVQRVWLTFLAINYFVYISMTKNLLRFFACVNIKDEHLDENPDEGVNVWEEDTELTCYRREHAVIVGALVIPLLIAITLGFPFGTYLILHQNKDRLGDEDFVATYGFLYRAYDRHYWEIVIMLRKGLIAVIAVFAHQLGGNLQGLLCVLVVIVALGLHLTFQPFTKEIPCLNYLETMSLSTTIMVFVTGLMMNDSKTDQGWRTVLSVFAILAVCAAILTMLLELVTACEEVVDMKLIELELMDISEVIDTRLSRKLEMVSTHYITLVWKTLISVVKILPPAGRVAPRTKNEDATAASQQRAYTMFC